MMKDSMKKAQMPNQHFGGAKQGRRR
jgi:hypothetical protein